MQITRLTLLVFAAALVLSALATCRADSPEIRAFWADAFHTGYRNQSQVNQLVADVRNANMNTIIVQVRRRGDVYYNSALEPWASDSGGPAFDALAAVCQAAHTGSPRLNVYAWYSIGPIYSSETGTPSSPKHPYRAHPEFLTQDDSGAKYDGSNYQIDLGHPGCADYHHALCMEVVNNYDIDGIQLDHIRFAGNHWGYNPESVSRFNARFGRTGQPLYNDPDWLQWRRDQVTAFVRRVYLSAIAAKPNVAVTAATNTRAPGITTLAQWPTSAAYSDTLQDWRAWLEEGILDIAMPMTYMREDTYAVAFDRWTQFTKDYHYNRFAAPGLGAYLNSVADTIAQIRRLRQPSPTGNHVQGLALYSYAVTNNEVPEIPRSEFIYALTHAPTVHDASLEPVFPTWVPAPDMPWKVAPTKGHLRGRVTAQSSGAALEFATVSVSGPASRTATTDSNGYFGLVDLPPGLYTISASEPSMLSLQSARTIAAGEVATVNFALAPNVQPPVLSNVQVTSFDAVSATIEWDTQLPSTSQVEFGPAPSYWNRTPVDTKATTHHIVNLGALIPGKLYHFRCISTANGVTGRSADSTFTTSQSLVADLIIDNTGATFTGSWSTGNTAAQRYPAPPADYQYCSQVASETATATWRPLLPLAGTYQVFTWYAAGSNRSPNSKFKVNHSGGSTTVTISQQSGGGAWRLLYTGDFSAGNAGSVVLSNAASSPSGLVIADAIRFVYAGGQPDFRISDARAKGQGAATNLLPKTVTASFSDRFYIQELDGSSAIRVDYSNSFVPGDVVQVRGTVNHTSGETRITATSAAKVSTGATLVPSTISSRNLGSSANSLVPPLPPSTGICTTGLLVKIAGKVSHVESPDFWVDDGSQVLSQGWPGIRTSGAASPPSVGTFVFVTGVVTPLGPTDQQAAGIRIRSAADLVPD